MPNKMFSQRASDENGNSNMIKTKKNVFTNSKLTNLHTTPIEILPMVAGKMYLLTSTSNIWLGNEVNYKIGSENANFYMYYNDGVSELKLMPPANTIGLGGGYRSNMEVGFFRYYSMEQYFNGAPTPYLPFGCGLVLTSEFVFNGEYTDFLPGVVTDEGNSADLCLSFTYQIMDENYDFV